MIIYRSWRLCQRDHTALSSLIWKSLIGLHVFYSQLINAVLLDIVNHNKNMSPYIFPLDRHLYLLMLLALSWLCGRQHACIHFKQRSYCVFGFGNGIKRTSESSVKHLELELHIPQLSWRISLNCITITRPRVLNVSELMVAATEPSAAMSKAQRDWLNVSLAANSQNHALRPHRKLKCFPVKT